MERNNLWMIGMIIVIVCLVLTNFQITKYSNDFREECSNYFDINDTCPCSSSKTSEFDQNLTFINVPEYLMEYP